MLSCLGHRLKNWIFPSNTPEEIANEIVYAIINEKDEIVLPVCSFLLFLDKCLMNSELLDGFSHSSPFFLM